MERIYLGNSVDLAHHPVDAYLVDDKIELEYKIQEKVMITSERVSVILSDQDKYMFTPYIIFVYDAEKELQKLS
jgi:hypothetical protein